MFILSLIVILSELGLVFGQGIPKNCTILSPNNFQADIDAGCVNGTGNFFRTEFPDKYDNRSCICCNPGTDDNPPDNCQFNDTLTDMGTGRVICNENFDCCLCGEIICNNCVEIVCGGDESCLGVDNIEIDGSTVTFAVLNCNGDISCFRTVVIGERISQINCNGDRSCGNATYTINKNTDPNTLVGFKGVGLSYTGDKSSINSMVDADFVRNLECAGDDSCPRSTFLFNCVDIGCPLTVNGDRAAIEGVWTINNAASLDTNGDDSVAFTVFNINMISAGGGLKVTGDDAALEALWTVTNANSLSCAGDGGCRKSDFTITFIQNFKDAKVTVTGPNGTTDSTWVLTNPASISCSAPHACQRIDLNAVCEDSSPVNGCPVICIGLNACESSTLNIVNMDGISCTSTNACSDSVFKFDNNLGGSITCTGIDSCAGTTMTDSTGGVIQKLNNNGIACVGEGACYNAEICGECQNSAVGCSLVCSGANSCTADVNPGPIPSPTHPPTTRVPTPPPNSLPTPPTPDPTKYPTITPVSAVVKKLIKLTNARDVKCIGGSILGVAKPACADRKIDITPATNALFSILCSGSIACQNGDFDIRVNPVITTPPTAIINLNELKCDSTSACENAQFYFHGPLVGIIRCNAVRSCANMVVTIDVLTTADAHLIDTTIECTSVDACLDTIIRLRVAASYMPDPPRSIIEQNNIKLMCVNDAFCPHYRVQKEINDNKKNGLSMTVSTVIWIIVTGILTVVIIILIKKNYQYKNIEKRMAISFKSNKNDRRNSKHKTNDVTQDTTQIKYADNTADNL